jgi:hypothetical protein
MASRVYPLAKQAFISGTLALPSVTVKVAILDNTYVYSATDQFRSAVASATIATSSALASKTVTNGVFDAADLTLSAVVTGHTIAALVLYSDTGNAATDPLICFVDGLSQATNGGDIVLSFDNGASKIFSL